MSNTLTRTICIKLDVDAHDAALAATQRTFNAAATWIARVCWDEGIANTNTAHHRVYGETRLAYGLGAQLAVCARMKAMEAIKAVKAKQPARDLPPVRPAREYPLRRAHLPADEPGSGLPPPAGGARGLFARVRCAPAPACGRTGVA